MKKALTPTNIEDKEQLKKEDKSKANKNLKKIISTLEQGMINTIPTPFEQYPKPIDKHSEEYLEKQIQNHRQTVEAAMKQNKDRLKLIRGSEEIKPITPVVPIDPNSPRRQQPQPDPDKKQPPGKPFEEYLEEEVQKSQPKNRQIVDETKAKTGFDLDKVAEQRANRSASQRFKADNLDTGGLITNKSAPDVLKNLPRDIQQAGGKVINIPKSNPTASTLSEVISKIKEKGGSVGNIKKTLKPSLGGLAAAGLLGAASFLPEDSIASQGANLIGQGLDVIDPITHLLPNEAGQDDARVMEDQRRIAQERLANQLGLNKIKPLSAGDLLTSPYNPNKQLTTKENEEFNRNSIFGNKADSVFNHQNDILTSNKKDNNLEEDSRKFRTLLNKFSK